MANDDWSWITQLGAELDYPSSSGYEIGVGATGMVGARYKFLESRLSGSYKNSHKKTATYGRTYSVKLHLRGYFYGPFYMSGGYLRAGYWSYFGDEDGWAKQGTTWEKHGHHWTTGLGYNDGDTELAIIYYWREHETPNEVESIGVFMQQRMWKGLFVISRISYSTWWQGDERWNGWTPSVGLAWRW